MRKPDTGIIFLTVWGVFLTVSVCVWLAWLQPSRLAGTVSAMLEDSLAVHCDIGGVSLSLLPRPSLIVSDLALHRGSVTDIELHTRQAALQLSWFSLLRLKPVISAIELDTPTLDISGAMIPRLLHGAEPSEEAKQELMPPNIPHSLMGLRITINNGLCRFSSSTGQDFLEVSGIQADARIPGLFAGHLNIAVDSLHCRLASGLELSVRDTALRLASLEQHLSGLWNGKLTFSSSLQLASLDEVMGHEISAPFRYFPMPEPLQVSLNTDFSLNPKELHAAAEGLAKIQAVLPMNGHNVPISLSLPFQSQELENSLTLTQADVRMEDDHVTIDGELSGIWQGNPLLKGRAAIHHFSLTRWFGFGRLMDPGLQHALDNITGSFDEFTLTLNGVVVPKLNAVVEDIQLSGSGSCKQFLKPDIRIDAHAKQADLNRVFTELSGNIPDLSHLPPPVLPVSKESSLPSSRDSIPVSYDIHISADDAHIMNFRTRGTDVHVVPAPDSGTMLKITVADLYGGTARSTVWLQNRVRIKANIAGTDLKAPSAALAGFPALTGLLKKADADISFAPGSALHMLNTLNGSLQASMEKGSFRNRKTELQTYNAFSVDVQAAILGKTETALPPSFEVKGAWNIGLDTGAWSAKVQAPQAALKFSTNYWLPCSMQDQSVTLRITLEKSQTKLFPQGMDMTVTGQGSFDLDKETLGMRQASAHNDALALSGDLRLENIFHNLTASGQGQASSSALKKTASLLGITLPSAGTHAYRKASIRSQFSYSKNHLNLSDISATLDANTVSGKLSLETSPRIRISGALASPHLDLDPYMESGKEKKEEKKPLPLDTLKNCDLQLDLSADKLRIFSTTLSRVHIPVSQKNGTLTFPVSARFPEKGNLQGQFQVTAQQHDAAVSLSLKASDIDLLALCNNRKQATKLSGTGRAEASLSSIQKNWSDWKHTLNGSCSFAAVNGAIISPTKQQDLKESRTTFQTLSFSTAIRNGIVSCSDFLIRDALLKITGKGTLNLATQNIDAKAVMTLAGIPEMPISITGDLFQPKTDYHLLGAVTGTVGNLGSSVFDLVGSVISAPFRLLTD